MKRDAPMLKYFGAGQVRQVKDKKRPYLFDMTYLQNTNFIHLFYPLQPDIGNIRETFFIIR